MFPHAVGMLRKVIKEEGDEVLTKQKMREMESQLQHIELEEQSEPSFENPYEDMFPIELRERFGMIIFSDENMNWYMPFGMQ
ncbi:MAG: hypothetical protein EOO38_19980 [Cytophagaceae bacterium]|nr:MAG: hypothetical protein EOO38_19980 [Cytophagaceae bacterium]